ncbi:MAG TPA: hypothetical protein VF552_01310 [Allosphingosinicella sp.]|jgi:hypothetical protein
MPAVLGRTLVGYDLLIMWKGARAAFSGTGDRLLLLVAGPLLVAMAAEGAAGASAALGALPTLIGMAAAMLAGFAPNLAIGRRLDHLRGHSIIAAAALRRDAAANYALFWNLLPLALTLAVLLGAAPRIEAAARFAPALLLSYASGAGAAWAARRAGAGVRDRLLRRRAGRGAARRLALSAAGRRRRVLDLVASRTGLPRLPLLANLVAFAALGAAIAAGWSLLLARSGLAGAAAFGASALLLIAAALLRQQAGLLRYLLFLGDSPLRAVAVPIALAGALALGATAAAAAVGNGAGTASAAAAILLLLAAAALLRALHHSARPRRAADFAIQIDVAALLAAAIVLPWIAPLLVAGRLFLLHRRVQALRHIVP